ncbi:MAG TPA: hypothetical protein DDZ51_05545 [Planctomycetaceae bacterium]|nr:hypothetical protein [Planctomycetaceae bacterium]
MSHFTDTENRRWNLSINVGTVKRVRELTNIDLLAILDRPQMLNDLAGDPVRFVDVLFVIIKPQADSLDVSDEQFGEALDGSAIESATDAFLEALVDFFPGARKATLQKVLSRAKETNAKAEAKLNQALSDGTIDQAITDALNTGLRSGN